MPRISEVTREQLPEEHQAIFDEIAASRGRVSGPFPVMLNSPEAALLVARLGHRIRFQNSLDPWVFELAVLAGARERDCLFEWSAHQAEAERVGLRPELVAAVRSRTAPAGLSEQEALIVRFVQELARTNRVAPPTYRAVADWLGPQGVTELAVTVGYYTLLACVLNVFEVEPPPGGDMLRI